MPFSNIKVIAFDADDTLWVNETLFRDAEAQFCVLMREFITEEDCAKTLFDYEMKNLNLYGYGIKPFILSLIEAAMGISDHKVSNDTISELIEIGKCMLNAPVVLIDGIEETLSKLANEYRLVVATKGDLLDQQRKLEKSGLEKYFHHIEVVPDKTPKHYLKLVKHLDIAPNEFLMVGNSLKSDILPVLEMGGHAVHIPFHTTWEHETVSESVERQNFRELKSASEIASILGLIA